MQNQSNPTTASIVANGYGIKTHVYRCHLVIEHGTGRNRSTSCLDRASTKLNRLVLIGYTGYVALDPLRWLGDINAALGHIGVDARPLTTSVATGPTLPALRRAQVLAATSPSGVDRARAARSQGRRTSRTTRRPARWWRESPSRPAQAVSARDPRDVPALLIAEAQAASASWRAWTSVPIPIPRRDIAALSAARSRNDPRPPRRWARPNARHLPH